jgi:hypothetical protein
MPIALTLVFGSVGRYAQGTAAGPVVGGMMIGVAFASVYGITLSIANERQFGTMGVWLATPQRLGTGIAVKALPHLVDGQLGALLTLGVACAAFGIGISPTRCAALLLCSVVAGLATAGFGVAIAACSVRFRDVFTAPNLAESLLIVCGGSRSGHPTAARPRRGERVPAAEQEHHRGPRGSSGWFPDPACSADSGIGLAWGPLGYAPSP